MLTIGWKESIDLPDWGIQYIVAKADTGARRSAVDVKHLKLLPDGRVEFDVVLSRTDRNLTRRVCTEVAHVARVRSSNGQMHERYFVRTRIRIGERMKEIELSLVCRKSMICRMLLGRKALEGDFVVDSSRKYVTRPRRKLALHPPRR